VTEAAEESGLREQVVLIADHAWLLDLKKIFKNKKYIIIVSPSTSTSESDAVVVYKVKEAEVAILKKIGRLQNFVTKRIDSVDSNTRFLLKYQQRSIETVTKKIKSVEKMFKQSMEQNDEEMADMTEDEKQQFAETKKKKNEILKMLNSQTSG